MNQILSTSMPINDKKSKNRKPIEISSILRFFGIAILIFGFCMLGTGVYAIYTNQNEKQEQDLEPTISIENKTDNSIILKVIHHRNISKMEYGWNNDEKTLVNGNNGKYLEQEIDVPSGKNTLYVIVQDENGKEITYEKQYETESNINFDVSGNKIKITYNGEKLISKMTYRWDDGDENIIEVNGTGVDEEIEAIKGLHKLTVVIIDENNNEIDKKSQKINGVSKPKVTLDIDSQAQHFVINASDDEKLTKIEFRLDEEQDYVIDLEDKDLKELEYVLPMELKEGSNILEVKVYNSNGIYEESAVKFVK